MNAVLYARVSTKRQAKSDISIPEQIRGMTAYCKERGYRIVGIYKDEGASARTDRRPVFQQMILDLTSGKVKVQAVIVFNRTRFFRDVFGAQKYERTLAHKDIEIIALDLPTEGMGAPVKHLTTTIVDATSQYFSELNGTVTLGTMLGNARQGYFNGGKPPYGYRTVRVLNEKGEPKSKLAIRVSEGKVAQRIFSTYIQGIGAKKTAIILNEDGIRWRNGKRWTKGRVLDVISNPIHRGEYIYNRRSHRTKKQNPEDEQIKIRVEPTVDEETFNLAQEIRKRNAPSTTNPAVVSSPLLLTGLLVCDLCRAPMGLETGKSGRYRYYNCSRFLREKSCPGQRVRVELLDREVLDHVGQRLFSVRRLSLLLREYAKDMKGQKRKIKTEQQATRSEIREKEGELENIYLAIRKGIVKEGNIDELIVRLKDEIRDLQGRLHEPEAARKSVLPPHVFSPAFLGRFRLRLTQALASDTPRAKSYLRLLLRKVRLKGEKVTLVARRDALLTALATNGPPQATQVPTAGPVWLPGLDNVDNRSTMPLKLYRMAPRAGRC